MSSSIFPSKNAWITPRTENIEINSNNCLLMLPQRIDKIDKVVVKASTISVMAQIVGGGNDAFLLSDLCFQPEKGTQVEELDITKYIVEEAKYNALPLYKNNGTTAIMKLAKNNTHYYKHKDTNIHIIADTTKGYWFEKDSTTAWDMAIQSSFIEFASKVQLYRYNGLQYEKIKPLEFSVSYLKNNPMIAQFRVYYTPLGESVKLQVPKTNPQPNQFCIPYSQQQPIVDNTTLGREMQSIANRAGCEKKEVVRTLHSINEYRSPHDNYYYRERDAQGNFNGNVWKLTSANLQIYSESLMRVTETWSKNWSYRSESVPINREFRSWNIPADVVQRNLLWQDYCLITRNAGAKPDDNCLLSANARKELMRGLDGTSSAKMTECNNMWFYRYDGTEQNGVALSCSSFGFGNSLVFSGKTKDNLSAGVQRVKSNNDDENYRYCKNVYYCNDDGKLDSMYIQLGSTMYTSEDAQEEATYLYPEFKRTYRENGTMQWFNSPAASLSNGIYLFNENTLFNVQKDPCEQLNFTYQLHLLSDDGFLVIGSTWASNNPLVKQRDDAQIIKVWKLTQHLPQGAEVMTTTYGTEQQDNLFVVDYSNDLPVIVFNWANDDGTTPNDGTGVCVTDEHNNVLIAYNDNMPATFTVHFTHDYKSIYAALKK